VARHLQSLSACRSCGAEWIPHRARQGAERRRTGGTDPWRAEDRGQSLASGRLGNGRADEAFLSRDVRATARPGRRPPRRSAGAREDPSVGVALLLGRLRPPGGLALVARSPRATAATALHQDVPNKAIRDHVSRSVSGVYLLRCRDGSLYAGATKNLERRLRQHQAGTASRYTRSRGPVTLVWFCRVRSWGRALRLEHAVKQLRRDEKLALCQGVPIQELMCLERFLRSARNRM
jgi:putative endonuclease